MTREIPEFPNLQISKSPNFQIEYPRWRASVTRADSLLVFNEQNISQLTLGTWHLTLET